MDYYQIALGSGILGMRTSMAKSWTVNAEQHTVPDLSVDRLILEGANGRTGKEWKKLLPHIRSRLGSDFNICESMTSGPFHAIDITREAIREGADAVIAVGGDGAVTKNDRTATHSTALGLIPLGTGSDFARTLSWKNDPVEAIEHIQKGQRSQIKVGVIDGEEGEFRYFINVADIHLSAKAAYCASRCKKFGHLCYVIGSLQAFIGHRNQDLRIKVDLLYDSREEVDEGEWETYSQVTVLCIGNAKYFGGGKKITPNADSSNGTLEVVILQDFKWYDFILNLHKLYKCTHLSVKSVSSISVRLIEVEDISGSGSIFVQSDGEHLGFLPRKFRIIPGALEMIG